MSQIVEKVFIVEWFGHYVKPLKAWGLFFAAMCTRCRTLSPSENKFECRAVASGFVKCFPLFWRKRRRICGGAEWLEAVRAVTHAKRTPVPNVSGFGSPKSSTVLRSVMPVWSS